MPEASRSCSEQLSNRAGAKPRYRRQANGIASNIRSSDLLISRNLRCPQLVDQLEFRIGEDRGGGVELIAQIADHFIVGGVREMMQSHGQGFVLKIWN